MMDKGKKAGIETRGVADHDEAVDPAVNGAREKLVRWQAQKSRPTRPA